jgi:hypothetical protein
VSDWEKYEVLKNLGMELEKINLIGETDIAKRNTK